MACFTADSGGQEQNGERLKDLLSHGSPTLLFAPVTRIAPIHGGREGRQHTAGSASGCCARRATSASVKPNKARLRFGPEVVSYGWALAPVSTPRSAGAPLALVAGCFCHNKNATSTAATSRLMAAMRYDPCSASTNTWLIAWCSAAGGRGSRPGSETWLACAPAPAILLAIVAPSDAGTPRCAS